MGTWPNGAWWLSLMIVEASVLIQWSLRSPFKQNMSFNFQILNWSLIIFWSNYHTYPYRCTYLYSWRRWMTHEATTSSIQWFLFGSVLRTKNMAASFIKNMAIRKPWNSCGLMFLTRPTHIFILHFQIKYCIRRSF